MVDLIVSVHVKAGQNLKGIAKTVDGGGFAFTHLDLPGQDLGGEEPVDWSDDAKLGNIEALNDYVHLRYVNLSHHIIADPAPLVAMRHLLSVNLSHNCLTTESIQHFKEAPLKFLQVLDMSHNRLVEYSLQFPMLRELYLSKNQLNSVKLTAEGSVLKYLDLRDNASTDPQPEPVEGEEAPPPQGLQDCDGFGLPCIETLLLTGNPIKSMKGLEALTGVEALDLTATAVESLDGLPTGGKLRKLKLQDCKIAAWDEMDKLQQVATLKDLNVDGNPLPVGGNVRGRILKRLPDLEVLNELPVTSDDREAAKEGDPAPAEDAA